MPDINHLFHIAAPMAEVFEKISSAAGIAAWWTEDTHGNGTEGGELDFRFNGVSVCKVAVLECSSPDTVLWECKEGESAWIGTRIGFELSRNEGKTRVKFSHAGWAQQDDFFAQCNFSWGRYMVSLRNLCEKGQGDPWPIAVKTA